MRWLSANWIWVVVVGGMLWMHFGMHRGHGGHGGHGGSRRPQEQESSSGLGSRAHEHSQSGTAEPGGAADAAAEVEATGHRHRGC